ncbi:MAG TPA: DNA repair protein RadC [Polyangiaceae bacterium]|nr:DNA repair protein RadC [Polyangiaceae bacterium]
MIDEARAPARDEPDLRERALLHGPGDLADSDLLALVLGTGMAGASARAVAARLLDESGGLLALSRRTGAELGDRVGVGPAKAARVLAALELGRRAALVALAPSPRRMSSFDDVAAWARPRLAPLDHEEVWLLALDGRNGLRGAHRIAKGGIHGCALTARDVLRPAVRDGASAIVLLHNHPSGDPTPSADDVRMTRLLAEAGTVVGVTLLDHVVVARGGATSLRDLGALPE